VVRELNLAVDIRCSPRYSDLTAIKPHFVKVDNLDALIKSEGKDDVVYVLCKDGGGESLISICGLKGLASLGSRINQVITSIQD
jgi:hypothetical protein